MERTVVREYRKRNKARQLYEYNYVTTNRSGYQGTIKMGGITSFRNMTSSLLPEHQLLWLCPRYRSQFTKLEEGNR